MSGVELFGAYTGAVQIVTTTKSLIDIVSGLIDILRKAPQRIRQRTASLNSLVDVLDIVQHNQSLQGHRVKALLQSLTENILQLKTRLDKDLEVLTGRFAQRFGRALTYSRVEKEILDCIDFIERDKSSLILYISATSGETMKRMFDRMKKNSKQSPKPSKATERDETSSRPQDPTRGTSFSDSMALVRTPGNSIDRTSSALVRSTDQRSHTTGESDSFHSQHGTRTEGPYERSVYDDEDTSQRAISDARFRDWQKNPHGPFYGGSINATGLNVKVANGVQYNHASMSEQLAEIPTSAMGVYDMNQTYGQGAVIRNGPSVNGILNDQESPQVIGEPAVGPQSKQQRDQSYQRQKTEERGTERGGSRIKGKGKEFHR